MKFCFWFGITTIVICSSKLPITVDGEFQWWHFALRVALGAVSYWLFIAAWDTARKEGKREAMEAGGGK